MPLQYPSCSTTRSDLKMEEKDCEITPVSDCEPMESVSGIKRWTTEENLSEGGVLQRKTQSLADVTNGTFCRESPNSSPIRTHANTNISLSLSLLTVHSYQFQARTCRRPKISAIRTRTQLTAGSSQSTARIQVKIRLFIACLAGGRTSPTSALSATTCHTTPTSFGTCSFVSLRRYPKTRQ